MSYDLEATEPGFYWIALTDGGAFEPAELDDNANPHNRRWTVLGHNAPVYPDEVHRVGRRFHRPATFPAGDAPWDPIVDARQLGDTSQEMVNECISIAAAEPAQGDFSIKLNVKRKAGKALVDVQLSVPRGRRRR